MPKTLLKLKNGKPTFIRLSEDERKNYVEDAERKGYSSLSEYLRFLLRLGFQVNT